MDRRAACSTRLEPIFQHPTLTAPFTVLSPPGVRQAGSTPPVDTIDARLVNAVYRNGVIATAQTVAASGQAAVRWYELNVPSPVNPAAAYGILQSGTLTVANSNAFDPEVALDAQGDLGLTYSQSDGADAPSVWFTGRAASDAPNQLQTPAAFVATSSVADTEYTYKNGTQTVARWGPWQGLAADPSSPMFWALGEYAHTATQWGAAWGAFAFPANTQGLLLDNTAPHTAFSPGPGAVLTAGPSSVVVTFNHQLQGFLPGALTAGVAGNLNAVTVAPWGPNGMADAGDIPLNGTLDYTINADGTSAITFTPTVPWNSDVYVIGVSGLLADVSGNVLKDAGGNTGTEYSSFRVLYAPLTTVAPVVSSVTANNGTTTVNNNLIPWFDALAVKFSKAMDLKSINAQNVQLMEKPSANGTYAVVPGVTVAYNPGILTAYLIPTVPLQQTYGTGAIYLVAVSALVDDNTQYPNAGMAMGSPYYNTFTLNNQQAPVSTSPLTVVRQGGNPVMQPAYGSPTYAPVGYGTVTMTEPVDPASLTPSAFTLTPQSGGLIANQFDAADRRLNAVTAFNPNTNQLVIVPTAPLGDDVYLFTLNASLRAANANHDPLTNPGGTLPIYATFSVHPGQAVSFVAVRHRPAAPAAPTAAAIPAPRPHEAPHAALIEWLRERAAARRARRLQRREQRHAARGRHLPAPTGGVANSPATPPKPPAATPKPPAATPPAAQPHTAGNTIIVYPGSLYGYEGQGIDTTAAIATFQYQGSGQPNATDFTATIQWNDGNNSTSTGSVSGDAFSGFTVKPPSFKYTEEGSYPATVTVAYGGSQGSATVNGGIGDAQLTGSSVYLNATSGQNYSGTVATFTDGNPYGAASDFTATIDWGDGTTTAGSVAATMVGGQPAFAVSGSHTYSIQGAGAMETVAVTIHDDGGASTPVNSTATVGTPPLTIKGGLIYVAYVNQSFSNILATVTGGDPSGGYSAQIDWGDGTTTAGTVGGNNVQGQHTYTNTGVYSVTVRVTNDGTQVLTSDTINVQAPVPQVSPNLCSKPGLARGNACATGGNPGGLVLDASGVNPASGKVLSADPYDLESNGFGMTWGQALGWSNTPGAGNGSNNGDGMVNAFLPSLQLFPNSVYASSYFKLIDAPYNDVSFNNDGNGGPTYFGGARLQQNIGTGLITIHDEMGDTLVFQGFGGGVPAAQQGQFLSFTDPYGNVTQVTNYTATHQIAEVQRTGPTGDGRTVTESYIYSYIVGSVNDGLISNVVLRRDYSSGPGSGAVRQVAYTYYDGTPQTHDASGNPVFFGNARDLELATIEDASGNPIDHTYYRYYTPTDLASGTEHGYAGGLKYFFQSDSFARTSADPLVGNPLTAPDSLVAPYADAYYEYDTNQRVTRTVTQGTACSCSGSTGQGNFAFTYTTSTNPTDFNNWATETTETLPDGNQNIVYSNFAGEVLLSALYDYQDAGNPALSGSVIATAYRYDGTRKRGRS